MRRRFNVALLPTAPPKKSCRLAGRIIGSSFNRWFVAQIKECGVTNMQFATVANLPYSTVMTWRKRCNPQLWGQCRIAEGLEALGAGSYDELKKKIEELCSDSKRF